MWKNACAMPNRTTLSSMRPTRRSRKAGSHKPKPKKGLKKTTTLHVDPHLLATTTMVAPPRSFSCNHENSRFIPPLPILTTMEGTRRAWLATNYRKEGHTSNNGKRVRRWVVLPLESSSRRRNCCPKYMAIRSMIVVVGEAGIRGGTAGSAAGSTSTDDESNKARRKRCRGKANPRSALQGSEP